MSEIEECLKTGEDKFEVNKAFNDYLAILLEYLNRIDRYNAYSEEEKKWVLEAIENYMLKKLYQYIKIP